MIFYVFILHAARACGSRTTLPSSLVRASFLSSTAYKFAMRVSVSRSVADARNRRAARTRHVSRRTCACSCCRALGQQLVELEDGRARDLPGHLPTARLERRVSGEGAGDRAELAQLAEVAPVLVVGQQLRVAPRLPLLQQEHSLTVVLEHASTPSAADVHARELVPRSLEVKVPQRVVKADVAELAASRAQGEQVARRKGRGDEEVDIEVQRANGPARWTRGRLIGRRHTCEQSGARESATILQDPVLSCGTCRPARRVDSEASAAPRIPVWELMHPARTSMSGLGEWAKQVQRWFMGGARITAARGTDLETCERPARAQGGAWAECAPVNHCSGRPARM